MLAVAFGLAVGICSAAIQVGALSADPVSTWVEHRASVTASGVISGEPATRAIGAARVWQAASVTELRFDSATVAARGSSLNVSLPFLVRLADGAAVPPVGSEVVITGRLGPSRTAGLAGVIGVGEDNPLLVTSGPGPVDRVANAMRTGLRTSVQGTAPDAAALVAGLSVGDESLQTPALETAMADSGLSHLTAVSGGNVAIILVAVLGLARLIGLSMATRVLVAGASLAFFVVLVHPQPSVLRASVMGAVVLVGLLTGGQRRGTGVLATSILLLIAVSPALAVSWGFALSVAATGGLIVLNPVVARWLAGARASRNWPPGWQEALAVTLAAQLATLPLLVAMGSRVGWAAIPANLLAMPAVPPVTILGLLCAMVGPLAAPIAEVLGHFAALPAAWIALVARTCSSLPYATIPWPSGLTGVLLLVPTFLVAWLVLRRIRRRYPRGIPRRTALVGAASALLVLATVAIAPPGRRGWPPPGWVLVACDVGQGDGLVVPVGDGSAVVVDVGPQAQPISDCLDDLGISRVSAILLTHFHADHVAGLAGLLRRHPVGRVYLNPVREPAEMAVLVDRAIRDAHVRWEYVRPGDVRALGDVKWEVLWPRRVIRAGSVPNNASVVILMRVRGVSILLPGDVEPEAQVAVMASSPQIRADVVKVPHHGSRYQHPAFPGWSHGRIALVSVGAGNDYGHPAQETLDAWSAMGAIVGRTDLDGDLAVVQVPDGDSDVSDVTGRPDVGTGSHLGLVTH